MNITVCGSRFFRDADVCSEIMRGLVRRWPDMIVTAAGSSMVEREALLAARRAHVQFRQLRLRRMLRDFQVEDWVMGRRVAADKGLPLFAARELWAVRLVQEADVLIAFQTLVLDEPTADTAVPAKLAQQRYIPVQVVDEGDPAGHHVREITRLLE